MNPHLREFSVRSQAKNHESATMIGSAPPVVANPADITSYYRAMKQRGRGWLPRRGWLDAGVGGVARARKGVSCAKREACIRRLCSTVVYDYLLTAVVFLVSPLFVPRTSDRRVSTHGDLGCSLSGLLSVVWENLSAPSASVASRNGKGAYLRRCAHITPTADKLTSLSSCLCLPRSPDFSGSYSPPLFLQSRWSTSRIVFQSIPLARRLRFRDWVRERTFRLGRNSFICDIVAAWLR